MTTAAEIAAFLQTLAPAHMAESWDNTGFQCGSLQNPVTRVLVALDPFEDVCQEAVRMDAQLIVTHHPLIFSPLKSVTDQTSVGRCVRILCANNICALNAHTNLDVSEGGVNDILAAALGLTHIQPIPIPGKSWGLLRTGEVPEQPLEHFLSHVKEALGCPGLRYAHGGRPVHKVAVGGGACASELMDAFNAGCDTFVTSDVKYNQFWDARDLGMTIIDAGHFYTENPVVSMLAEKIRAAFPDLAVQISQIHHDCMKFF